MDDETLQVIIIGVAGGLWAIGMLLADIDYTQKISELWTIENSLPTSAKTADSSASSEPPSTPPIS